MERIDIENIRVGETAQADLYSEKGELLLTRGTSISSRHLDMIRRRNLFSVYLKPSGENHEIEELLAGEPGEPGAIDFDTQNNKPFERPQTMPGMGDIQPGRAGLDRLCRSHRALVLDRKSVV